MRIKGPAAISALTDIGLNIYDYGWGAHRQDGLTSRKFVVSTTADATAGLGIVAVSTAIGTAIPIPGVGTAVGFAVGVGLQYVYSRWGREAWHNAVDWAGRRLQDGYDLAKRAVGAAADKLGDAADAVKDTVGDAVEGGKKVLSALNPFG
jgi:hypothetical protein